jgi:hypothetical protein
MKAFWLGMVAAAFALGGCAAAQEPLRMSVYATAGDVQQNLMTPEGRERVAAALKDLNITGIFLEGRRGDSYVSPEQMKPVRDFFLARGFRVSGGIATVPGREWGTRQNGPYGWLNYQSAKTQRQIAEFFRENAGVFDEIIIDDFYCSEDTSPESDKARGARDWGQYRRDLLVGLLPSMVFEPARAVRPDVKLIIKYPQWYDRFHLFGYEPARMSAPFNRVWVGTEVRNPKTQRMGYVQPFESFVNFRWIAAVAGSKVYGAWFDHIECTARNFVDQAWQSTLAGAGELTLFNLGNVVKGHPGHALLRADWPTLVEMSAKVRTQQLGGIAYYKPVNSTSEDNMWLMDNLGMIGLPVVPVAQYPSASRVAILGVQASADPKLMVKMKQHLARGATLVLTPALLRKLGRAGEELAIAGVSPTPRADTITDVVLAGGPVKLPVPLEVDLGLASPRNNVSLWAASGGRKVPYLVTRKYRRGAVIVWNVRTFSEADYEKTKERLLAPAKLGLPEMPRALADDLRKRFMAPLGVTLSAPAGVAYYLFGTSQCLYNFNDHAVDVVLNGKPVKLAANAVIWKDKEARP